MCGRGQANLKGEVGVGQQGEGTILCLRGLRQLVRVTSRSLLCLIHPAQQRTIYLAHSSRTHHNLTIAPVGQEGLKLSRARLQSMFLLSGLRMYEGVRARTRGDEGCREGKHRGVVRWPSCAPHRRVPCRIRAPSAAAVQASDEMGEDEMQAPQTRSRAEDLSLQRPHLAFL